MSHAEWVSSSNENEQNKKGKRTFCQIICVESHSIWLDDFFAHIHQWPL